MGAQTVDLNRVGQALLKADEAGNTADAQYLAATYARLRNQQAGAQPQPQQQMAPDLTPEQLQNLPNNPAEIYQSLPPELLPHVNHDWVLRQYRNKQAAANPALVGAGQELSTLGNAIGGLFGRQPDQQQQRQQVSQFLQQHFPVRSGIGAGVADIAALTPAEVASGGAISAAVPELAAKAAATPLARIGTGIGIGAAEGAGLAGAHDQSPLAGGVVGGVLSGLFHGAGEGVANYLQRNAPQVEDDVIANVRQATQRPTEDLAPVAEQVQPSPETIGAARRLGIEQDLTPAQLGTGERYQQLEGALAAIPSTQLNEAQKEGIKATARQADKLIQDFGGSFDKAGIDATLRGRLDSTIKDLSEKESEQYRKIADLVEPDRPIDTVPIMSAIGQKADHFGGVENLNPLEKQLLNKAENNDLTFAYTEAIRKRLGEKLNRFSKSDPYTTYSEGEAKWLYGILKQTQQDSLHSDEERNLYQVADQLTQQRKGLEADTQTLFGNRLDQDFMPRIGVAVEGLSRGNVQRFNNLMKAVPEQQRQAIVTSSLDRVFQRGSRSGQFNPAGFSSWYEGLQRDPEAKRLLLSHLPREAQQRLDDVYKVSRSLADANSHVIRTGITASRLNEFEQQGTLARLFVKHGSRAFAASGAGIGAAIGGSPGAAVGGATGTLLGEILAKPATPFKKAADDLLSSERFRNAVFDYVTHSPNENASQRALQRSPQYKKWLRLAGQTANEVNRIGLMRYLTQLTPEQEQQNQGQQ